MKISREELNLLIDGARREYIELSPNSCLPGTFKALSEGDRIAMCWLQSAIQVLNKKDYMDTGRTTWGGLSEGESLTLEYDLPDSTPMTEGFDSTSQKDDDET